MAEDNPNAEKSGALNGNNSVSSTNSNISKAVGGGSTPGSKQTVTKGVFLSPRLSKSMELIREGRWDDSMFAKPSGDLLVVREIREAERLLFASWRAREVVDESQTGIVANSSSIGEGFNMDSEVLTPRDISRSNFADYNGSSEIGRAHV